MYNNTFVRHLTSILLYKQRTVTITFSTVLEHLVYQETHHILEMTFDKYKFVHVQPQINI